MSPSLSGPAPWRAGPWEREHAASILAWRHAGGGLSQSQLSTLCDAIGDIIHQNVTDSRSADEVAHAIMPTRHHCDSLDFTTVGECLAYAMQHVADRYGRITQVLENLLRAGHLPIRKRRLTVLDVGAGPAPALYAVHDFYDDLRAWVDDAGQSVQIVSATDAHPLDRGPAWDRVLHQLSEQLAVVRGAAGGTLPFARAYTDLKDFSVRDAHITSRESAVDDVIADFDRLDEPVDRRWAQIFATEESKQHWAPSGYDFIVMANFLTNIKITDDFADEISKLGRSLTPGGILVAIGGTGEQYLEVWPKLDAILRVPGLIKLDNISVQMQANNDLSRSRLIRTHISDSISSIFELCTDDVRRAIEPVARKLPRAKYIELEFPQFQVQCWKNQAHQPSRYHTRKISEPSPISGS